MTAEPAGSQPTPLSPEETSKLLALTKQADTVELKLTVPETSIRLPFDRCRAGDRSTRRPNPPGVLLRHTGLAAQPARCGRRARRSQGAVDDSVVKLRPVVPNELPAALRKLPEFGVEVDALPGGFVCSASFKAKLGRTDVRPATQGKGPLRKLFTKGQRRFFDDHAPDGIALDDLSVLGPMNVMKLKFKPADFARRLVVELWLYPDGSRILELSTKCQPSETFQVAAEARAFLSDRGVDLTGEQQTKTATALAFFAGELRAG